MVRTFAAIVPSRMILAPGIRMEILELCAARGWTMQSFDVARLVSADEVRQRSVAIRLPVR
jgi:hypothetical protein